MTCLEHLIENQLARFEEHPEKTYEQYIDDIKSDINFEDAGITAEQCYEITQYVLYSYCSDCPSKHKDERKKGKWIHIGGDEWLCDECGFILATEGSWEHPLDAGNYYCKHCGADMREETNDG